MPIDDEQINQCVDEQRTEWDRYYQTLHITLAVRHALSNLRNCLFVSAERTMTRTSSNEPVRPDIIIQHGTDLEKGIIFEIKTSISEQEEYARKELKNLDRYDEDLEGWETSSGKISNHDVVLICSILDSQRIKDLYESLVKTEELIFEKSFSIWEMTGPFRSPKYKQGEVIVIRKIYGKTRFKDLEELVGDSRQLVIPTKELAIPLDKLKFTRKEPPEAYMIDVLWNIVFPILPTFKIGESFQSTLDIIISNTLKYYPPWAGIQHEQSQVRESWIRKAIDILCEIGLIRIIDEDEKRLEISYEKPRVKDFKRYIMVLICKKKIREGTSFVIGTRITLNDFES